MTPYSHNPFREKTDFSRTAPPTENQPRAVCKDSAFQVVKTQQKEMNLLLSLLSQLV